MSEKRIVIVDSQILNDYQACPTKLDYSKVRNIRPLIKEEAFDKGDLVHFMLKYHYKILKHNQNVMKGETTKVVSIDPDMGNISNRYMNSNKVITIPYAGIIRICIAKGERHLLKLDLPVETCQDVIKTYIQYAEYYQHENLQVLEIEKPFAKVLYEDEWLIVIYSGRIDMLTTVAIYDHKSSSRRGEPSALSNQFMGYCWGFNVNNLVVNKIGFQKTLKPEDKFERYTKSYPKEIIQEWVDNTIKMCLRMVSDVKEWETGIIPDKNFTSCDKYGGCIFQEICGTLPEAREFVISRKYKIGTEWNPVEELMK